MVVLLLLDAEAAAVAVLPLARCWRRLVAACLICATLASMPGTSKSAGPWAKGQCWEQTPVSCKKESKQEK